MRIYVGGLPYSTNNEGLRRLFADARQRDPDASVVQDKYTNESKGFGFVDMPGRVRGPAPQSPKFNGHSPGWSFADRERSQAARRAQRRRRWFYGGGGG